MGLRRAASLTVLAVLAAGAPAARAVSDGNYDSRKQHCTGHAQNKSRDKSAEKGCYTVAVTLSDAKHEYVLVGVPMTKNGESPKQFDVCLDLGSGTKTCAVFDKAGVHPQPPRKGTPADPASGLHLYFGADDNLDNGEHDSSPQVNNGPSDGGGIQVNVAPQTVASWLAQVQKGNTKYLLTHPLPLADAGVGFCADGLCFSLQTQQRKVFSGGKKGKHRDVSNYDGKKWDPQSCSGPSDKKKDCGGRSLKSWNDQEGDVYAEPGIQIYEDPDAQASPIGPYPIPSLYVGTCGLVAGGGSVKAPASPFTNSAGQLVFRTGC